jgi:hypothetical protein
MRLQSKRQRIGRLPGVRYASVTRYQKAKWLSLAIAGFLVAAWIFPRLWVYSSHVEYCYEHRTGSTFENVCRTFCLRVGEFNIGFKPKAGVHFYCDPVPKRLMLLPPTTLGVYVLFIVTRRHRRKDRQLCIKCGYNLTGNESGVCPECGSKFKLPVFESPRRGEGL